MQVYHCERPMALLNRTLKPTPEEQARGVIAVEGRACWCSNTDCRRRRYQRREQFDAGWGEWSRVRAGKRGAFASRMNEAQESDWVWGYHPETFAKVKRTVR